jgi:hypothetical protein
MIADTIKQENAMDKELANKLITDFTEWSGGFTPDECDSQQINDYLQFGRPEDLADIDIIDAATILKGGTN